MKKLGSWMCSFQEPVERYESVYVEETSITRGT
jgi:hypothetical protein